MDIWPFKPNQPEQINRQAQPRPTLSEKTSLTDLVKVGLPQWVTGSRAGTHSQPGQFPADLMAEAERRVRAADRARREARQARREAKRAAAEAKRQQVYAVRARKREELIKRVASQMTGSELARWSKMLDLARKTGSRMDTTSKDVKHDLAMVLPVDILKRVGIEPDSDNIAWTVTGQRDPWRERIYRNGLIKDDQPAADGKMVITAQDIIDAARKARGDVKPNQQIDPGRAVGPSERGWHRK
jgi:hypothetical protein